MCEIAWWLWNTETIGATRGNKHAVCSECHLACLTDADHLHVLHMSAVCYFVLFVTCFHVVRQYLPIRQSYCVYPSQMMVPMVDTFHWQILLFHICMFAAMTSFVKHAVSMWWCVLTVFILQWHRASQWGVTHTRTRGSLRLAGKAGWGVRERKFKKLLIHIVFSGDSFESVHVY